MFLLSEFRWLRPEHGRAVLLASRLTKSGPSLVEKSVPVFGASGRVTVSPRHVYDQPVRLRPQGR